MYVKSGSYAGTGVAQSISGLGFQPKVVIIKGGANVAVISIDAFGADQTKTMVGANALATGRITSLDAGGFSVGTDAQVNANGTTYHWLALGDNGGADIETGTYTGNGSDNRNISLATLSGTPNVVMVMCATTTGALRMRTSDMGTDASGNSSQRLDTSLAANNIQSISSGSFQVGTANDVNTATGTPTYYWLAFKNATSLFKVLTYNGNSTDNTDITGVGFDPQDVFIKRDNSQVMVMRFKDESGDNSFKVDTTGEGSNRIQSLITDGFQVGTDAGCNTTGGVYFVLAFRDTPGGAATAVPVFMNQYRQRWN